MTTMQLCFCFDFVATVVHITLPNLLKFLFTVPVNTNTELDPLIRISCHYNLKSYCNSTVLVTNLTLLHSIYKTLFWSIIELIFYLLIKNGLDYNVYYYN